MRTNDSAAALIESSNANEPDDQVSERCLLGKRVCHLFFKKSGWELERKGAIKRMSQGVIENMWMKLFTSKKATKIWFFSVCMSVALNVFNAGPCSTVFKLSWAIGFILGPSSLFMLYVDDGIYFLQISILERGIMQIRILDIMHVHSNMHQRFYFSFNATLCISPKLKTT